MTDEVRYHRLRPRQAVARRRACPVAYVPLGNLEWHGLHNPLGADTLQAEGFAIACARQGGGVAFPSLYYGENRLEALMEANAADRDQIAAHMELPSENFTADRQPFDVNQQTRNYNGLLMHILAEVATLGFNVAVLVAGHYPLIDHARAAVLQFNQWRSHQNYDCLAWTFCDYLLVDSIYPHAGDHAARWETSHLMALHPETVDLEELGPDDAPLVGIGGHESPREATGEFGREIIAAAVDVAVKEVHHRLENARLYFRHGHCFDEGLWRSETDR